MNIIAHLFENQLIISILYKKECKGQYRTSFWSEFCIRIAAMIIIQQEPELAHLCYRRRWAHRLVYATLFFSATKKSHGIQNQAKNHFQMLEADQSQGVFEGGESTPYTNQNSRLSIPGRKTYRFAWFGWLATMIFENKIDHQDFLQPRISNLDQTL